MGTMPNQNDILRRIAAQAGSADALEQLQAALRTPDGQKAARIISDKHAADLERAAQAAIKSFSLHSGLKQPSLKRSAF